MVVYLELHGNMSCSSSDVVWPDQRCLCVYSLLPCVVMLDIVFEMITYATEAE